VVAPVSRSRSTPRRSTYGMSFHAAGGFVTAAKSPRAVIARLNDGVNRALQTPDVRGRLEQLGLEIEGGTPEKFGALIKSEVQRLGPLVRARTLQIE
ncbi:MAG TPA: tripartite tricarboxylate transporter substrate-binding protein, partial [Burkholderiales bacterium]